MLDQEAARMERGREEDKERGREEERRRRESRVQSTYYPSPSGAGRATRGQNG